jgi:tetratricopeptide (TPR) repeat protein
LGNPQAALENVQKAIGIYEQLSTEQPANEPLRAELARFYQWVGLTLGASAVNNLGDTKGALEYYRKSVAILERLVAQDSTNITYRENLEAVYAYIAQLYSDGANQAGAVEYFQKSLAITQAIAKENPTDTFLQREVAINYSNLCGVMILAGDKAGAVESCRRAVPIFETLAAADPNDKTMRLDGAIIHRKLAEALGKADHRPEALKEFRTALRIFDELSGNTSASGYPLRQHGLGYLRFSEFLSDTGDIAGAFENAHLARQIFESAITSNAKNAVALKFLAETYAQLGKCQSVLASARAGTANQRAKNWRAAKDWYQKSLSHWEDLQRQRKLIAVDANEPDQVKHHIAECDAALKQ